MKAVDASYHSDDIGQHPRGWRQGEQIRPLRSRELEDGHEASAFGAEMVIPTSALGSVAFVDALATAAKSMRTLVKTLSST